MSECLQDMKPKMLHALGMDYKKKPYRNYYCEYGEHEGWENLVDVGYATKRPFPKGMLPENGIYYGLTEEGIRYATDGEFGKEDIPR